MRKLVLMMGVAGAGKSAFLKEHSAAAAVVSRDEIRYSLLKPGQPYFSKETQVFNIMCDKINELLMKNYDVYVDATHLTRVSRYKTLRRVHVKPSETDVIWIKVPLETAIAQNELRKGTPAYVPKATLRNMYNDLESPEFSEGFNKILIVEDGKIKMYQSQKEKKK